MLLGGLKKDFPYPDKVCPYCNWVLVPVNAIHWQEDIYQYKALYLDKNPNCSAYNEGQGKPMLAYITHQKMPFITSRMFRCQSSVGLKKSFIQFINNVVKY